MTDDDAAPLEIRTEASGDMGSEGIARKPR
jgi:hypothetical protein